MGISVKNTLITMVIPFGWVASGSDACTEDEEYCTIDNVRCFALKTYDLTC
jgi:hypothetical protein